MTIKRREDTGTLEVYFVAVDPRGQKVKVRKSLPGATQREAEQYQHRVRAEIMAGTYGRTEAKSVPTFAEFARDFMDGYAITNNKPSSLAAKEQILRNHLVPAFGKMKLDAIGPREIEAYKGRAVKAELAGKTINNQLSVLRKVLAVAAEWNVIERPPLVRWAKTMKPEFDFLSFDEAARLVKAADEGWKPMIVVALRTGLRIGELRALSWEDVDLRAKTLTVRRSNWKGKVTTPKSNRTRVVDLSDDAVRALQGMVRRIKGLVFSDDQGRAFTYDKCAWALECARKRAGLRRISWHDLRHTFASHLVMRGADLKVVQECLGHATMDMTLRYAHLSPKAKRHAVSLLDQPAPEWAREGDNDARPEHSQSTGTGTVTKNS